MATLVLNLLLLVQTEALRIPEELPLRLELERQLEALRLDSKWRTGDDDLVCALLLAAWAAKPEQALNAREAAAERDFGRELWNRLMIGGGF